MRKKNDTAKDSLKLDAFGRPIAFNRLRR